jgi:uncharacterized protein YejL (UPF0352 family)
MGFISDFTIEKYSQVLNDAANKLINHQQATQAEIALSNNLITNLVNLRKLLAKPILQKDWFAEYYRIYVSYFAESKIRSYTDLILNQYEGIWKSLGITEKIEIAEIRDTLYNFPNVTFLTSENFEVKIKKPYQESIKTVALTNDLQLEFYKEYKPNIGVNEVVFFVIGKENMKLAITVWVFSGFIKVEIKNEGISSLLANIFLKALFHTIFE